MTDDAVFLTLAELNHYLREEGQKGGKRDVGWVGEGRGRSDEKGGERGEEKGMGREGIKNRHLVPIASSYAHSLNIFP